MPTIHCTLHSFALSTNTKQIKFVEDANEHKNPKERNINKSHYSPDPLRLDDGCETLGVMMESRRLLSSLAMSARKSFLESRRPLLDADLTPESTDDSRRFRDDVSVLDRPNGSVLAMSASVSRLVMPFGRPPPAPPPPPPPPPMPVPLHSRSMSVSWASELRRRLRLTGGDVSAVSVGGDSVVICAAESRRPPSRCLSVVSSICSRSMSSQPLPPCHTRPTWWLRIGRLHTKHMAVIVLNTRIINRATVTRRDWSTWGGARARDSRGRNHRTSRHSPLAVKPQPTFLTGCQRVAKHISTVVFLFFFLRVTPVTLVRDPHVI